MTPTLRNSELDQPYNSSPKTPQHVQDDMMDEYEHISNVGKGKDQRKNDEEKQAEKETPSQEEPVSKQIEEENANQTFGSI